MWAPYLLSLLYLQLHADAQAAQGVLEGLPQGPLHQHLVESPHHATTQEHHRVGQELDTTGKSDTAQLKGPPPIMAVNLS